MFEPAVRGAAPVEDHRQDGGGEKSSGRKGFRRLRQGRSRAGGDLSCRAGEG